MDNFLQSLLGNLNKPASPIQAVLMDYLGLRQNPQGGVYKDFEEPLSTQYGTFMDPMSLSMINPETMQIIRDLQKKKSNKMLDQNWENGGNQNPMRWTPNLGVGFGE